jgi:hypothetical protein
MSWQLLNRQMLTLVHFRSAYLTCRTLSILHRCPDNSLIDIWCHSFTFGRSIEHLNVFHLFLDSDDSWCWHILPCDLIIKDLEMYQALQECHANCGIKKCWNSSTFDLTIGHLSRCEGLHRCHDICWIQTFSPRFAIDLTIEHLNLSQI